MKEQGFCFLKGLVDCSSGRIQECNNMQTRVCILEVEKAKQEKESKEQGFCFQQGRMVECSPGRIQDCNVKRLKHCPLLKENSHKEKD